MANVTIALNDEPADDARRTIRDGIIEFNLQHVEKTTVERITLTARTESGEIVGGLTGDTMWGWLHVDLLWVVAVHRRQGIGRALLRRAEREAQERGCRHVYLDTFDFQAKPFYERHGYTVFGIQDDFPPGHRRYYLRKMLNEQDC
jgi:ribosomal protein S18 acetylase RimI-like enzyme